MSAASTPNLASLLNGPEDKASSLSPTDLAELMGVFNEVTAKLEQTHVQLRDEVSRLNAELESANEALQRSKRLAALGEMAAGISHEIRNPLGSIKLHTRMLLEDLESQPEQSSIVRKIDQAVRGLDLIVGDVLSFSREIRVGLCEHESEALLHRAVESCRAELEGVRAEIAIDDDAQIVQCDAHLIGQALLNLVRNAAQSCREAQGGSVVLGASRTELGDTRSARPGTELWVRDEGSGIDPGVIERMFNPFFTTRAAGTGLGLAIVHRIVDAHGGSVRVKNNADVDGSRGATVSLCIPDRAAPKSEPVVVVRAGAMAPTRIGEEVS